MRRGRKTVQCLRGISRDDFCICECKFPEILLQKLHCFRVLLDRKDFYRVGKSRALHGDRSRSGPDIVENGMFRQLQLRYGNRADFHLCHRDFAAKKCLIRETMRQRPERTVPFRIEDRQRRSLPLPECLQGSGEDLLPVQREVLTDKELCLLHSEFFQLSADLPVEIGSASKDERASGAFQFGRKICLLTMHAEECYMIPRAPDLCEKVSDR